MNSGNFDIPHPDSRATVTYDHDDDGYHVREIALKAPDSPATLTSLADYFQEPFESQSDMLKDLFGALRCKIELKSSS